MSITSRNEKQTKTTAAEMTRTNTEEDADQVTENQRIEKHYKTT